MIVSRGKIGVQIPTVELLLGSLSLGHDRIAPMRPCHYIAQVKVAQHKPGFSWHNRVRTEWSYVQGARGWALDMGNLFRGDLDSLGLELLAIGLLGFVS